jgi:hypothetical protein
MLDFIQGVGLLLVRHVQQNLRSLKLLDKKSPFRTDPILQKFVLLKAMSRISPKFKKDWPT